MHKKGIAKNSNDIIHNIAKLEILSLYLSLITPYNKGVVPEVKTCVRIFAIANPVVPNSLSTQLIKIPWTMGKADELNIKNNIVAIVTFNVVYINPIQIPKILAINCNITKGQEAFLDS